MEIQSAIWVDGFKISGDFEANLLMKYYQEVNKENNRLLKGIKEEISFLEEQGREQDAKSKAILVKIEALLEDYMVNEVADDDKKETKTLSKYKLTRGELVIEKESFSIVKPEGEDEIATLANYPKYGVQEPKFLWGELKKLFEINDKGLVVEKESGKVVDTIKTMVNPASFKVKISAK